MAKTMRTIPAFSYFSGVSPESLLTGVMGDFAINKGSASTATRLWFKHGPDNGSASTTSWSKVARL